MKSIQELIPDIYSLLKQKQGGWFTDELAQSLSQDISRRLQTQLGERKGPPTLRLSKMGECCPKALWHSIHTPELAEALPPAAEIKYSFGHIIEALIVTLAKAAGHEVTGEQDAIQLDGIWGHRDCIINGYVVDVKSSSTPSFPKFEKGYLRTSDSFGYLDQLDGYMGGSLTDPLVRFKHTGYILAVDKQLGKLALYEHTLREQSIKDRIESHKRIVALDSAPPCECGTEPYGESGNIALDLRASYSAFKHVCFPYLRTFLYSKGPVFFSHVAKIPTFKGERLKELNKYGIVL